MKFACRRIQLYTLGSVSFVCLVGGGLAIKSIPTTGDHDRVSGLLNSLVASYPLKTQRKDGKGPAIYMTPNAWKDYLSIYGDYSDAEITEIRTVVGSLQQRRKEKKVIEIRFYKEELNEETFYREVVVK